MRRRGSFALRDALLHRESYLLEVMTLEVDMDRRWINAEIREIRKLLQETEATISEMGWVDDGEPE